MSSRCPCCDQPLPGTPKQRRNAEWAALRLQGLSYPQIAARYGVDHTTVQNALKPAMRARKSEQGRFRYYLNNVLPRELDAEAAQ